MTQWEKLQKLDQGFKQRIHELYDGEELPMDVRHYLAPWLESQEWDRAAQDPPFAMVLFQVLLENMDNQYGRFVQEGAGLNFVHQSNFRRFKQNFQRFEAKPDTLAGIIDWFLKKEREILRLAELPGQVQTLQVNPESMETDSQRSMQRRVENIQQRMQVMDHTMKCLEDQQDEFDFKYQTFQMEGSSSQSDQQALKVMINNVDQSRKSLLSALTDLLVQTEEVMSLLVEEELMQWRMRQQKACIGAPEDTSLEKLEKWFTSLAESMFLLREFLQKLEELSGKVSYDRDPIITQKPLLQQKVDNILTTLLKSAFVVESQPSVPGGKGPLVLRTNVQFSVKTRFLVKVPELNHAMQVTVTMDNNIPHVKGYRRFNVLGTSTKALNMTESMQGGMVADFRHLTLKEQKIGAGGKCISDLSLSVTEELHIISFHTKFDRSGLSLNLEASSLPVVIISNTSQQQCAWASVLWFNATCSDHKNVMFFTNTPPAPWPQVRDMLNWQFLSAAGRGLDAQQLDMIALKIFGKQDNYDTCTITWAKFNKENVPDNNFSLWMWLDGILFLVRTYLADVWKDGSVVGFISKKKERAQLKKRMDGTFLLRFSESIKDGGITFSWVETDIKGERIVRTVQPFTRTDLAQIPFPEIIRNFQILETANVPVNPLWYLYPDIPKDKAFGKYYTEKTGEDSPYFKYIKTKLMFVSKESGSEGNVSPPFDSLCLQHSSEAGSMDPQENSFGKTFSDESNQDPSPLLCAGAATLQPDDDTDLMRFLSDPNMLDGIDLGDGCQLLSL